MPTHDLTCARTHTQVALYWRFGWWWHTHTYLYPCPRLIICINTYFFFTFTGAFFLHACGDTRNLRNYFTSVRRVFLVERVVLQTILWDIRAWSTLYYFFVLFSSLQYFMLILSTAVWYWEWLKCIRLYYKISDQLDRQCKHTALVSMPA